MQFSEVISSLRSDGNRHEAAVTDDWSQGRATFGGLLTALANAAMRRELASALPLRGLQVTFVGPGQPGSLQLHTQILRRGKSVILTRCDLLQDDVLVVTVVASYGLARTPPVELLPTASVPARSFDAARNARYAEGISPNFHRYFERRWVEGGKPGTGSAARHQVYLRHLDAARCTEAHVIAIADVLPSSAMAAATRPTRGSSLMWSLEIIDHDFDYSADSWWRVDNETQAAVDGYINETGRIINPSGRVAALSQQIFALY
jgi:acyl-CoA thioesterase